MPHIKLYSPSIISAQVDAEDFNRCNLDNWCINKANGVPVSIRAWTGTRFINLSNYVMNDFESEFDHIDRNIFNNQKNNLRKCTHQQNCLNRRKSISASSTSLYKGVDYREDKEKWRARIKVNNRQLSLGHFDSEIKAAKAYNRAAIKYFGEFALVNVIL